MKKNNSKNLIKTITVATLVFSVGTAFALNTAGAAGFDIMDKVVVDTVAEQETAQMTGGDYRQNIRQRLTEAKQKREVDAIVNPVRGQTGGRNNE